MSTKKPKLKIKAKNIPTIGWSEGNKNVGTLRKIEDANQQEKELDSSICASCDNYLDEHSENGYCFNCHMQACTPGNHY